MAEVSGKISNEGKEWNKRAKNPSGAMADSSARPCAGTIAKSNAVSRE